MIRTVRSCVAAALTIALMGIFGGSAHAQDSKSGRIVCWKDKSGKVVGCGDRVPPEYQDSATREMDRRGVTRATTESAEEAARRRAQDKETSKQKAEEQKRMADQKRQDTALVNTFSNEKEIDQKRDRDLQQLDSQVTQLQVSLRNATERYTDAKTRSDAGSKDKKLAEALKEDVAKTAAERQRLEQQIAAKEKEKDEIRQRYADQKKRYLELRGEAPSAAAPAASPSTQKAADQGKADKSQSSQKAAATKEQVSDAIKERVPKGLTRDSDPTAAK